MMLRVIAGLALACIAVCAQTTRIYGPTAKAGTPADFSVASTTKPMRTVTGTLPATCTVGEMVNKTDATAGQNIYGCTSTNTWTLQSGGSSGGGGGSSTVSALMASGTSLVLTHNGALTNAYALPLTCFDEDDGSSVSWLSLTSATANAITINFVSTLTNVRCTATVGLPSSSTAFMASGTSLTVTHNLGLANAYALSCTLVDQDDGSEISGPAVSATSNSITFTFVSTLTNIRATCR